MMLLKFKTIELILSTQWTSDIFREHNTEMVVICTLKPKTQDCINEAAIPIGRTIKTGIERVLQLRQKETWFNLKRKHDLNQNKCFFFKPLKTMTYRDRFLCNKYIKSCYVLKLPLTAFPFFLVSMNVCIVSAYHNNVNSVGTVQYENNVTSIAV